MQMHTPTGHAITPCPVTEHRAIPTPDEILQVQIMTSHLRDRAAQQYDLTDFSVISERAQKMLDVSKVMYERMLGLMDEVTDVTDPMKMLLGLKQLGAVNIESVFEGKLVESSLQLRDRNPAIPTGVYSMISDFIEDTITAASITDDVRVKCTGKKVVLGSGDVHQYGNMVIHAVLDEAGINVVNLGANVSPELFLSALIEERPDAVIVCTYNGCALTYAKTLKSLMEAEGVWGDQTVYFGGRLNDDAGESAPVDVSDDLVAMGIAISSRIEDLVGMIADQN